LGLQAPDVLPDENPPHVHRTRLCRENAYLNGDLLAGDAPNKAVKQARRWLKDHQAELVDLQDEFQR
jgi:hypothetical protein